MRGDGQPVGRGREAETASLTLERLKCVRNGRSLFKPVDLSLQSGEMAIIKGPNGIGKSSLLRAIAGLLEPVEGQVHRHGIQALCDDALALDHDLTLSAALLFWAALTGKHAEVVKDALQELGLDQLVDVPVHMLSTGQRKRATLARLVAARASIWLLDEPANGLDDNGLDRLRGMIDRHRANGGVVVAATHQPIDVGHAIHLRLEDDI
jgi:heme exporter protein A